MVDYGLKDKVAIVTGANNPQGIGAAIARCLAEAGADVVINYVSEKSAEKAERTAEAVRGFGRQALVLRADVSKEEDVKTMMEKVDCAFGRLDILCCNAGVNSNHNIDDMSLADWQRVQDTNITGGFLCSKYALPLMRRNHYGRIIMTSSMTA